MSIELNWADKNSDVDIGDYSIEYESTIQNNQTTLNNEKDTFINKFIYGDNLQSLDYLLTDNKIQENGGVDLIYIDPPYNTGRIFKNKQEETCYNDKFKTTEDYLNFIYPRLKKAHELLNKTGTLYVHCDYRTSSYIKLLLDEIFSAENYKNEIIWCYNSPSNNKYDFPKKHDNILRYSKESKCTFNKEDIRVPYNEETIKRTERNVGVGFFKQVKINPKGKIPEDWWIIPSADRYKLDGLKKVDYPTQKPVKLLERIIKASSNPQDIVLDFFAGSGTTLTVAEQLNRRWIGIDNSSVSKKTIIKRLKEIDDCKFEIYNIKRL